jgi:hypothetical protein
MRTSPRFAVPLMVGAILTACSAGGEAPEESVAASQAEASVAESDEGSGSAAPTPGGALETSGPYTLPAGTWSTGLLHLEVAGGVTLVLDLPLASGETGDGRTTLHYENFDEQLEEYSIGSVVISFFLDADSIGIDAGGLQVLGPCDYTFDRAVAGDLAGDFACAEDVQAQFQGDPREVTIVGSFTGGA